VAYVAYVLVSLVLFGAVTVLYTDASKKNGHLRPIIGATFLVLLWPIALAIQIGAALARKGMKDGAPVKGPDAP
jgi:hypothetical protein